MLPEEQNCQKDESLRHLALAKPPQDRRRRGPQRVQRPCRGCWGTWARRVARAREGRAALVRPERQVLGWFQPSQPALFTPETFPVFNLEEPDKVGRWYGFPARFPGDPPPDVLVKLVADVSPWFTSATGVAVLIRRFALK